MKGKAILVALLALAFGAQGAPVSEVEANAAARGWVVSGGRGTALGFDVESSAIHTITNDVKFYSVKMRGRGTVFMSDDTDMTPVLAFTSATNDFSEIDVKSPLWVLLSRDVAARKRHLDSMRATQSASYASASAESGRWETLIASGSAAPRRRMSLSASALKAVPDDLRVDALVKSKWSQGDGIWNYYTPRHYVCGCVATAAAQVMRYFHGPVDDGGLGMPIPNPDVEAKTFQCSVDGKSVNLTMQGGAYAWDDMPLTTAEVTTDAQRQNIGKLVSDLGISVKMMYAYDGSGSFTKDVPGSLMSNFGYSQAVWIDIDGEISPSGGKVLHNTLFANFDAGRPCVMSIPGHAIVADGYGYEDGTPYVHLNMGWAGSSDFWYNLPDMTEAGPKYDAVDGIGYNIFPSEGGVDGSEQTTHAIVSGRVLDDDGVGVADCLVEICDAGTINAVATMRTDERGVWAAILPPGTYDISSATDDGEWIGAVDGVVLDVPQTSKSGDTLVASAVATGNSWGNDIVLEHPSVRVGGVIFSSIDRGIAKAREIAATDPTTPVLIEVLDTTRLKKTQTIDFYCVVTATNATPAASQVTRIADAQFLVAGGASLVLSNVVFSAGGEALVDVADGGCCGVAGVADFGVPYDVAAIRTAAASGFRLLGSVEPGFAIDCAAAKDVGAQFGVAVATTAAEFEAICAAAPHIVNFNDPLGEMRGKVQGSSPNYTLSWFTQPVPIEDSVGYYVDAAGDNKTAARIDRLFDLYSDALARGDLGGVRQMVIRKSGTLSRPLSVPDGLTIVGEDVALSVAPTAGFTVTGGALAVSGISFSGYKGNALFLVDGAGASLSLGTGVSVLDVEGTGSYGAVAILNGTASVSGVTFDGCRAMHGNSGNADGGAVYVASGCSLSLTDCTIVNCKARRYGGAVYVAAGASISLAGNLSIAGNLAGSSKPLPDDIYLKNGANACNPRLSGTVTGSVGVRWSSSAGGFGNNSGDCLIWAASVTVAHESVDAFFSDASAELAAVPDDGLCALRWTDAPTGPQPCDYSEANVRVKYADGTTEYYVLALEALESVSGDAEIALLGWNGHILTKDVTISHNVTLISDTNFVPHWPAQRTLPSVPRIERGADCSIIIESGASLTLRDVSVYGCELAKPLGSSLTTKPLFDVRGGSLELQTPSDRQQFATEVAYVYGVDSRNAGAICVWGGGTFVMREGATIHDCSNLCAKESDGTGRGGAVLVDHSSAVFSGGTITGCMAYNGGGVFIGNGSTIQIYGDTRICDNTDLSGNPNNLVVSDLDSLVLAGGMPGSIGYTEGVSGDTAVFGRAVDGLQAAEALAAAHNFTHDVTGAIGMAVTGAGGTLLVWNTALASNGTYTDENGAIYTLVGGDPVQVSVSAAATGLVYNGAEQVGVGAASGFTVDNGVATAAGSYQAKATLRPGFVWDDGSAGPKTIPWSIAKATYDMSGVTFADATFFYDDKYHTIGIGGELPQGVTVSYANERQRDVGVYTATASFTGDAVNYEAIQSMTATLAIVAPEEPTSPDETDVAKPQNIAFTAIAEDSGTWTLSLTTAVENCWYTLYETNSISGGFAPSGDDYVERRKATATDVPTMIFTRPSTGAQLYWHVVAEPEDAH